MQYAEMQAAAAAKKRLLEAQARAAAEAQDEARQADIIPSKSSSCESSTAMQKDATYELKDKLDTMVPQCRRWSDKENNNDTTKAIITTTNFTGEELTPRQKAAKERLDAAKARAAKARAAKAEDQSERRELAKSERTEKVNDTSHHAMCRRGLETTQKINDTSRPAIRRLDTPPISEEKSSKENLDDSYSSSPTCVGDIVITATAILPLPPISHRPPQLSMSESTTALASTEQKLTAKERMAAAKARAQTLRLAAENKRTKAAEEEKRLQQQQQQAEEAKLNAKKKADEEWTKRERAAQDQWLAEQERIAKLEAEEVEVEERLEQEEKKGYAVPHMIANNGCLITHRPQIPSVRGPTAMASLDSLLRDLPSANSSGGSLASKKRKDNDDDDASVFTAITKASLYSTARSVTSHYSQKSTTSQKSISSHYSRAHEAASVASKVKEAYKARLQQYQVLPDAVLKTTPQWERYYLKDQGRIYSAEYGKLWSTSSYKQNVNGIVKRGSPVWGKERLRATKLYLNHAYRAKLDDLDEDDVSIASWV